MNYYSLARFLVVNTPYFVQNLYNFCCLIQREWLGRSLSIAGSGLLEVFFYCMFQNIEIHCLFFRTLLKTGWWFGTWLLWLSIFGNVIIPTDELIFFRGVGIPPTSNCVLVGVWMRSSTRSLFHGRSVLRGLILVWLWFRLLDSSPNMFELSQRTHGSQSGGCWYELVWKWCIPLNCHFNRENLDKSLKFPPTFSDKPIQYLFDIPAGHAQRLAEV